MTYDEFRDQLDKIRVDFLKSQKRELSTIEDLYLHLDRREALRAKKSRGARSLRGFDL